MINEIVEVCACGSQIEIRGAAFTTNEFYDVKARLDKWRGEHKHDMPVPKAESTTAKGDFGYVRYAQGTIYQDDDDEDEDD